MRLEALRKPDATHSGLLEVFNVPEFARILIYGWYSKRLPFNLAQEVGMFNFHFALQISSRVWRSNSHQAFQRTCFSRPSATTITRRTRPPSADSLAPWT